MANEMPVAWGRVQAKKNRPSRPVFLENNLSITLQVQRQLALHRRPERQQVLQQQVQRQQALQQQVLAQQQALQQQVLVWQELQQQVPVRVQVLLPSYRKQPGQQPTTMRSTEILS